MLRIYSAKIFREDLESYALPMYAFTDFNDVEKKAHLNNDTFKFCLPVSIGDFKEVNIKACFSKSLEEIKEFVREEKTKNYRKAFIISDFLVRNIEQICYSGIIGTFSKEGNNFIDKTTTIDITLKNPILTYATENISPRDLKADIRLTYNYRQNPTCAFPIIDIKSKTFEVEEFKSVIYDAYLASSKIHEIAEIYEGNNYSEYSLFYIDDKKQIHLYEIVGEDSFLGIAEANPDLINAELDVIKNNPTLKRIK